MCGFKENRPVTLLTMFTVVALLLLLSGCSSSHAVTLLQQGSSIFKSQEAECLEREGDWEWQIPTSDNNYTPCVEIPEDVIEEPKPEPGPIPQPDPTPQPESEPASDECLPAHAGATDTWLLCDARTVVHVSGDFLKNKDASRVKATWVMTGIGDTACHEACYTAWIETFSTQNHLINILGFRVGVAYRHKTQRLVGNGGTFTESDQQSPPLGFGPGSVKTRYRFELSWSGTSSTLHIYNHDTGQLLSELRRSIPEAPARFRRFIVGKDAHRTKDVSGRDAHVAAFRLSTF